jgi:hypothetical protein
MRICIIATFKQNNTEYQQYANSESLMQIESDFHILRFFQHKSKHYLQRKAFSQRGRVLLIGTEARITSGWVWSIIPILFGQPPFFLDVEWW